MALWTLKNVTLSGSGRPRLAEISCEIPLGVTVVVGFSGAGKTSLLEIVAGLRRLVDPATASGYAQVIDVIENATDIVAGKKPPSALGVSAPSDSTVIIELGSPAAYLPSLLSHTSTCPVHRPTLVTIVGTTAVATSDQYPKPRSAIRIPMVTLIAKARTSILAIVVKRSWRCSIAECCTPAALMMKPEARTTETQSRRGSW